MAKKTTTWDRRLAVYGLSSKDIELEPIEVEAGQRLTVSGAAGRRVAGASCEEGKAYHSLVPKDFTQLKEWIGVPDEVARLRPSKGCQNIPQVRSLDDEGEFTAEDHSHHITLARRFLHGDSRLVSHFGLQPIGKIFPGIRIGLAMFSDIIVGPKATLDVGSDVNVLMANRVRIYEGGRIRLKGSALTLNCASIKGNIKTPNIKRAYLDSHPVTARRIDDGGA